MKKHKPIQAHNAPAAAAKVSVVDNNALNPQPKVGFFNRDAIIFSVLSLIAFGIIRMLYPTPDYIPDTKGYLLGAITEAGIGYRPMGTSVFLQKMYRIEPSLVFVAWSQYLLHLASGLMIVHAFLKIYPFNSIARKVLYAITLVNLPVLHLANTITADSLFISLTVMWAALVIYMIRKPNLVLLGATLVLLWMTLFVRYNALIYPVVMIIGLMLTRNRTFIIIGTVTGIILTYVFYTTTVDRMEEETGTAVFSGFTGWQLGSNAMKAYKAIDGKRGVETDDTAVASLDRASIAYIDSVVAAVPDYKHTFEVDFMWNNNSPFKKKQIAMQLRERLNQFNSWTKVSLVLGEYGKTVIKQYPGPFFQHYILPNAYAFFYPQLELFIKYTAQDVELFPQIATAYGIPKKMEPNPNAEVVKYYSAPFQFLYTISALFYMVMLGVLIAKGKRWALRKEVVAVMVFVAAYWFSKMGFEVFASPLALRYVLMAMPIISGAALMIVMIWQDNRKAKANIAG